MAQLAPSPIATATRADRIAEWRPQIDTRHGVTVFDLDRTITKRGTYSPFLLFAARRLAPWRLAFVPVVLACMLGYKLKIMSRRRLKERMHRLLLGDRLPRAAVDRVTRAYAAHVLRTNICPGARELIARERAEGRTLMLATAAHRFYATAIAEALGIDRVIATESVWTGDMLRPGIRGENCYGAHKAHSVARLFAETGLLRAAVHVRFYSDDASDLPCFLQSDQPIPANPSAKLVRLSREQGWTTLSLL